MLTSGNNSCEMIFCFWAANSCREAPQLVNSSRAGPRVSTKVIFVLSEISILMLKSEFG
jgi:hypothetical protein